MKITLDLKSLILGFMAAALIITAFSFKSGETEHNAKYKTTVGEFGMIILDTETGKFIISDRLYTTGKFEWRKGDFTSAFETGKDYTKK